MAILVVNAGSSSFKLDLLDRRDRVLARRELAAEHGRFRPEDVRAALSGLEGVAAVGHRVVHGGLVFRQSVRLDAEVEERLRSLVDLAPLHLPVSLEAMEAVGRLLPGVPAVACFDTAFHASLPAEAATYALPAEWRRRWSLRRFGFHGLSHAHVARRAGELVAGGAALRVVSCHLGAGASLAAIRGGSCVDTTMGFTPLEGLVMATRSGSVDPGLILWLEEHAGLTPRLLSEALEQRSGLLALAGTADMRAVLERSAAGDEAARLALAVYLHRLRAGIAAMAAALDGLDVLAFTGGVGENAPAVRGAAASGLGFLGVALDEERNRGAVGHDAEIGAPGTAVRSLVIAAREDLEIAREVRRVLADDDL